MIYIDNEDITDPHVNLAIESALEGVDLYPYFGEVDRAEFIDLIYGPDEQ